MKIKAKEISFEQMCSLPTMVHTRPIKQSAVLRTLVRLASKKELKEVQFQCKKENMEAISASQPCLYLMNHSSFIDLKIAFTLIAQKPFYIVCTSDGFIGKERLMRKLGCIPTYKFITDVGMVRDLFYVSEKLKSSILMYPEASYSFDGTQTPLPEGLGKCVKKLGIPVVIIKTRGAFIRDPLYNNLQLRKVPVSATMKCVFTKEQLLSMPSEEINQVLQEEFTYDQFKNQQEDGVRVREEFRADGLHRVLYKCPKCKTEGKMLGKGFNLSCRECGKEYELSEDGKMKTLSGDTEYEHIPDWYRWQRSIVKQEILDGKYQMDIPVRIGVMKDMQAIYIVGEGRLKHSKDGFLLVGCNGKLSYRQSVTVSYSLYADYFWYEIGDVICIGEPGMLFYCFPTEEATVAKARLATEELYLLSKEKMPRSQVL